MIGCRCELSDEENTCHRHVLQTVDERTRSRT